MGAEKSKPDGFLAFIEAKIAALTALAETYRTAQSLGALGQPGEAAASIDIGQLGPTRNATPFELPTGALLGKSIPAAVKLYLSAVKKKQTVREIKTALQEGGVESTAASFENTVTSALNRLKVNGEVLRFKDGWALAEFYPESLRNRIAEKDAKPAKSAKKKHKAKAAPRPSNGGPSLDQRIVTLFTERPLQVFTLADVGKLLNQSDPKVLRMAFARLVGRKKAKKHEDGSYSAGVLEK